LSEVVDDNRLLPFQLVRSIKRKTLGLQVKQGKVVVRAPYYLPRKYIEALVQKKSAWLRSKISEQNLQNINKERQFIDGCYLWVFGQYKKLSVVTDKVIGKRPGVYNLDTELQVVITPRKYLKKVDEQSPDTDNIEWQRQKVKKQLEKWFKEQAESYLAENLPYFAAKTALSPKSYQIRQYKARWGSCNSRGELSFNYLLMMMPKWVVDYVIIHELCHLEYLNHSSDFWLLVAKKYPMYKAAKVWMKTHQQQLSWSLN